MKTAGLLLIVVGAIMLVWTGFSFTKKEKVLDIGPLEVSADKKETVNWPPYIGAVLVVGGIAVFAMSRRRA
ncbi:hypothetical protein BWI93_02215 [Siphonobacter sp. BAB-5385]|uniref:hypothetical protein n=1 Tax=unclassified Siphonobacter TaxID=2635712 RepID=UPI000B9EB5E5|nr:MULTISPECIES: hypothetical protein [unclassified Siphonobacter]OZI09701.1 hypothetical protein BWI93_02215 [Siphonobacter sp. BAB-5385]PMD92426.1 hypothetical protein BWI97_20250 [Siphonobacter sp. BAB-5405]